MITTSEVKNIEINMTFPKLEATVTLYNDTTASTSDISNIYALITSIPLDKIQYDSRWSIENIKIIFKERLELSTILHIKRVDMALADIFSAVNSKRVL